jgi:hypothetical protein
MKKLVALVLLLAPVVAFALDVKCQAGKHCSLHGVLRIYRTPPVFTSALQVGGTCIPLALPKSAYDNYEKWSDRKVVVSGLAHSHSVVDTTVYYELKGRNVTGAICGASAVALYVTELKLEK